MVDILVHHQYQLLWSETNYYSDRVNDQIPNRDCPQMGMQLIHQFWNG